jgi:ubiquinone/menaquinone biosynthesis C-methylase UbiE
MFLNPNNVLDQLELHDDMSAAEFGSGSGGFSIPLAKKLSEGIVYAIDILAEPLSALKSRARLENIKNIRLIKSNLEKPNGSTLVADSLDLVVIPNVLFEIEDKNSIILEAKRVLKKRGLLVIIDWREGAMQGPAVKIAKPEVLKLAEKNGFKYEKDIETGNYHYGLVFRK